MKSGRIMRWITAQVARRYLGRPDQAEIIATKYPRLRDLPAALLNEAAFSLGLTRSFKLTGLNVELTNRCNLHCTICPHRSGERSRPDCDMDLATFKEIIDGTPDLKILLPYQWGEPLLSPILVPAIEYAAGRGVRVMVTTNGTLLDERNCRALVDSGLERLTVSFDGSRASHEKIRAVPASAILDRIHLFKEVRDTAGSSCALDVSMVVDELTEPEVAAFKKNFTGIVDRIQCVPRFVAAPRRSPCRELWRGILVVLANGDVTVCCADYAGAGVLGNVAERSPVEWFNSEELRNFRRRHRHRDWPQICCNCGEYHSSAVSARFS